jgi:hypothetical protein
MVLCHRGNVVAWWVKLDEDDDHAQQLGHFLISASGAAAPARPAQSNQNRAVGTAQRNRAERSGSLLFLDDFELIGSRGSLGPVIICRHPRVEVG